jgi:hypothetical protein
MNNFFLAVLMRFLHIGSVVGLIGGALYSRAVLTPVLNALPEPQRAHAAASAQARFRTPLFVLLALVVLSGIYNLMAGPHHSQQWQIWFGIKMLLVLHILAAAILWATSPYGDIAIEGKGKRRLAGICISGLLIVLIGAYLRYLTSHGL